MIRNIFRYLIFPVLNAAGPVYAWLGISALLPLVISMVYHDDATRGFVISAVISLVLGIALSLATHRFKRELTAQHGFLLVSLIWITIPLLATVPFLVETPQYSLTALYFEMVSCLTTTGATILSGLDHLPISLNLWRSLLSWMGGMGLIVLAVAILPLLGVGGAQMMKAETSGPMKESRLTPRIADTAKALYMVYLIFSVLCAVSYHLAGMTWSDAIMHMMTTISLSGIATHDASFQYWNSAAIDWVAIVFMFLSGINFSLHFVAVRHHSLRLYFKDVEARYWFLILFTLTLISVVVLWSTNYFPDLADTIRYAAFSVVSVASSTGYADTDYSLWPNGLPFLIIVAATYSSCAGSTGGGMKLIRILILFKLLRREMTKLLYPNAITAIKINDALISDKVCTSVFAFVCIWIMTYAIGALVLMVSGMPVLEAFSAAIAMLCNMGLALGDVGPSGNYQWLNDFQLNVCSFLMITGRLEIFTFFVLFTRGFWRA